MCPEQTDCDCFVPAGGNAAAASNPLCQNAAGMYSNTQSRAKGYPGTRELQVLQGLGEQAIVASICPSNVANMAAADFGYRPAIAALIINNGMHNDLLAFKSVSSCEQLFVKECAAMLMGSTKRGQ